MKAEKRTVVYDHDLKLEAYRFQGIKQKFPAHFHNHYVIGLIEVGVRTLIVNNCEYRIVAGDMLLFNPGDSHGCTQFGTDSFAYRGINLAPQTMQALAADITGSAVLPYFTQAVLFQSEYGDWLRELHTLVMNAHNDALKKEEKLLFLMAHLFNHAVLPQTRAQAVPDSIETVCRFMDKNYTAKITLNELATMASLNKYTFLRSFARAKGLTPYRYLENVRIGKAKELLRQGLSLTDVALETGFADQSHFSAFFKEFIGLTPGQYRTIFHGPQASQEKHV